MLLNLSSINSYWLTCQKSQSRWIEMHDTLKKANITSVMLDGEITTPYTIGVAKNHRDALLKSEDKPVIILEDDARLTSNIITEISIPENTDAVYLGTSLYGRILNQTILKGVIAASHNDNLLKLINMLSLHAVIYISQKYKLFVINILNDFIKNPQGGMDDLLGTKLHYFNVYALRKPLFYQKDGHSEFATNTPITPLF